MRIFSHWHGAVIAAMLTAVPLTAAAAGDATNPAGTPTPAKPAASSPGAAAKPATGAATKPATPATGAAAKPATPAAGTAAKPATPGAGMAPKPTVGMAARPGVPAAGAAAKPAELPADPVNAHLTLAQATFGLKGTGPLMATIEVSREGKPPKALHCELYADKAPVTVANFVGLARGLRVWKDPKLGQWVKRPLYDGNLLHRTIPELLIQGGDPNCTAENGCRGASGAGDPGYAIADEIRPELRFDRGGRLAMSNRGPGTGGSQFFITERDASWLTGGHTIFGQCDGAELITELSHVETGSRDLPKAPLAIKRITISHKGS